jgi:hypothetical protein
MGELCPDMKPPPLHRYAIEFHLPGIGAMPAVRAHSLTHAFRKALVDAAADVRWLDAVVTTNTLRCILVAPHEDAVRAAAREAHLAPDQIFELGPAVETPLASARAA